MRKIWSTFNKKMNERFKMFRSILLITCLLSFHAALYSQTHEKQNPVIFLEETLGGALAMQAELPWE
jgi:hypothetical protein